MAKGASSMHIHIDLRRVSISPTLQKSFRAQLAGRLRSFSTAVLAARVELSDRNGRRGGGDKRCRIFLTLAQGGRIIAEDIRANLRTAFRGAVARAEHAAQKQLRLLPA